MKFLDKLVLTTVILGLKPLFRTMLSCDTHNSSHHLRSAVFDHQDRPLITYSNHQCSMDDPIMWLGTLSTVDLLKLAIGKPDRIKWTIAAQELFHRGKVSKQISDWIRVIPVVRRERLAFLRQVFLDAQELERKNVEEKVVSDSKKQLSSYTKSGFVKMTKDGTIIRRTKRGYQLITFSEFGESVNPIDSLPEEDCQESSQPVRIPGGGGFIYSDPVKEYGKYIAFNEDGVTIIGGVDQPGMLLAVEKLTNQINPQWVHIFPEGFCRQGSILQNEPIGKFKLGLKYLIEQSIQRGKPPLLIPVCIKGFDKMKPFGRRMPKWGSKVEVIVGKPIDTAKEGPEEGEDWTSFSRRKLIELWYSTETDGKQAIEFKKSEKSNQIDNNKQSIRNDERSTILTPRGHNTKT